MVFVFVVGTKDGARYVSVPTQTQLRHLSVFPSLAK